MDALFWIRFVCSRVTFVWLIDWLIWALLTLICILFSGHVYCWPCILHYLALSDAKWRKCPICYESVYGSELKRCGCYFHPSGRESYFGQLFIDNGGLTRAFLLQCGDTDERKHHRGTGDYDAADGVRRGRVFGLFPWRSGTSEREFFTILEVRIFFLRRGLFYFIMISKMDRINGGRIYSLWIDCLAVLFRGCAIHWLIDRITYHSKACSSLRIGSVSGVFEISHHSIGSN